MAKKRIDRSIDLDKDAVTFTVLASGDKLTVNVGELPAEMVKRIVLHGINAKVGDSAADPTVDAMEQLKSTWEQLKSGVWNTKGAGGGARVTILAEALASVTGQDIDAVVDKLDAMSPEDRKALPKKYPKVKAAMDEIKAKRATEAAKASKNAAKDAKDEDELAALLS